jgi:GNAT superfamily N-acetyltransferase
MTSGSESGVSIRLFQWADWAALWQLRYAQLAELGVPVGGQQVPAQPDPDNRYEPDYHCIGEVYLTGAGGFWLAWSGEVPIGHVGAQDLGGCIELRRMYVRAERRRRGVGSSLVATLIQHCARRGVRAVELWTSPEGPGRLLYQRLGFRVVSGPGPEFQRVPPVLDEIRMRLDLIALIGRGSAGA